MPKSVGVNMLEVGDIVRVKKNYVSRHEGWMTKWAAKYKTPMVVLEASDMQVRVVFAIQPEWLPRPMFKKLTLMPQAVTKRLK